MAGDDDGDRIFPVGGAHGAGEAHVAQAARQVAIAPGGPVRDGAQDIPHAPLKRRAGGVQGDVEGRGGPAEVVGEVLAGSGEETTGLSASVPLPARDLPWPRALRARRPGAVR